MKRLLLFAFDRPVATTAAVVLVTLLLGLQIPRLAVDTSAEGLMVENDPARQYYEEVKQKFGADELTVVLVKADDVFTERVLGVVARLSTALAAIRGVTRVESLTTVKNIEPGRSG